jgi:dihydroorotase
MNAAMKTVLITNARIVNEGRHHEGDVWISSGRIEALGGDLSARKADLLIDAAGKTLLPGMIDDQVHFREPGLTHKGDLFTESRAAVAGGITSYMEMPNTNPPTVSHALLEDKYRRADGRSFANYGFYLGADNSNIEAVKSLDPSQACGIKVFMGSSTGNLLVDDPDTLEQIFKHAPTLVATHCENDQIIAQNAAAARARFGDRVPMIEHPRIRSAEACFQSSALAVDLARRHGTRLHVLHLTTAREMALFVSGPIQGKTITAEVCVHHLFFDQSAYAEKGSLIKCNPAIKTAADKEALLDAVHENRIDVIATDHAPHTLDEKQNPYFQAPSGLPLVQHALVGLLEHYHEGRLPLEVIVEKTSHAPARLFDLIDRGFIREGYWADLVLVDLHPALPAENPPILYKCGWSPFEGIPFRSAITATIVSGHLVYHEGQVQGQPYGMRLAHDR